MNWLQTFAFVAFAGFQGAYSGRHHVLRRSSPAKGSSLNAVYDSFQNSFPYKQSFLENLPNRDLYASSVVSQSAGPLCSGFHVQPNVVITAASCVFRKGPQDLLVISNTYGNETNSGGERLEFLPVNDLKIHEKYNPSTNEHNMAILLVNTPDNDVPVLLLPRQNSLQAGRDSNTFIVKFTYDEGRKNFYSVRVPAEVKVNLNECGNGNLDIPPNVFFCVSRMDSSPYSFGLRDLGTPLIYKTGGKFYFLGMFAGHKYHSDHASYLYQDASGNLAFINSFNEPLGKSKSH